MAEAAAGEEICPDIQTAGAPQTKAMSVGDTSSSDGEAEARLRTMQRIYASTEVEY